MLTVDQMADFARGYKTIEAYGLLGKDVHKSALEQIETLYGKFSNEDEKQADAEKLLQLISNPFGLDPKNIGFKHEQGIGFHLSTLRCVVMVSVANWTTKIPVIKYLREHVPDLTLKQGMDMVNVLPSIIHAGWPLEIALKHQKALQEFGCRVELKEWGWQLPQAPHGFLPQAGDLPTTPKPVQKQAVGSFNGFYAYFEVGENRMSAKSRMVTNTNFFSLYNIDLDVFFDLAETKIDRSEVILLDEERLSFNAEKYKDGTFDIIFSDPKIR